MLPIASRKICIANSSVTTSKTWAGYQETETCFIS
jgi:hypothetical protein